MKTATFYRYILTNPQHTFFSCGNHTLTDSLQYAKLYERSISTKNDLCDFFDSQDVTLTLKVKVTIELDNLEEE